MNQNNYILYSVLKLNYIYIYLAIQNMIKSKTSQYFIYKFIIYIKTVRLQQPSQNPLEFTWKTSKNFIVYNQKSILPDKGQYHPESQLILEQIIQRKLNTGEYVQLNSELILKECINNDKKQIGKLKIDLIKFVQKTNYNNGIKNQFEQFLLQRNDHQKINIILSFVSATGFQIQQNQVKQIYGLEFSFQNLPTFKSNYLAMPKNIEDQIKSIASYKKSQIIIPNNQRNETSLFKNKSKPNLKNEKKSKQKKVEMQKFLKIIQQKDQIINQLEIKLKNSYQQNSILIKKIELKQEKIHQLTDDIQKFKRGANTSQIFQSFSHNKLKKKNSQLNTKKLEQSLIQFEVQKNCLINQNNFYKQEIDRYVKIQTDLQNNIKRLQDELAKKNKMTFENIKDVPENEIQIKILKPQQQSQKQKSQLFLQYPEYNFIKDFNNHLGVRQQSHQLEHKKKQYLDKQMIEIGESYISERKKNIKMQQQLQKLINENRRIAYQNNILKQSKNNSINLQVSGLQQQKIYKDQIQKLKRKNKNLQQQLEFFKQDKRKKGGNQLMFEQYENKQKLKEARQQLKYLQKALSEQKQKNKKIEINNKQITEELKSKKSEFQDLLKSYKKKTQEQQREQIKNEQNQKKLQSFDRLEKKYKQLQNSRDETEQQIQKMIKQKKINQREIKDLKEELEQKQAQINKLKQIQLQYKNIKQNNLNASNILDKRKKNIEYLDKKSMVIRDSLYKPEKLQKKLSQVRQQMYNYNLNEQNNKYTQQKKLFENHGNQLAIKKVQDLQYEIQTARYLRSQQSIQYLQKQKQKIQQEIQKQYQSKIINQSKKNQYFQKQTSQIPLKLIDENQNDQQFFQKEYSSIIVQKQVKKPKALEQQNQQLKQIANELSKKILEMQQIKHSKNNSEAIRVQIGQITKHQIDRLKKDQQLSKQIQQMSIFQNKSFSLDQSKNNIKNTIQKIKKAFQKRIQYLKGELAIYHQKQLQLLDKDKQLIVRQIQISAAEAMKKINSTENNNLEAYKQKAKMYDQLISQYEELKKNYNQRKFNIMDIDGMQIDQHKLKELQSIEKQSKIKIHALQTALKNAKSQKQAKNFEELEALKNQHKKTANQLRESYQKSKTTMKAQIQDFKQKLKLKQNQIKQLVQQLEKNKELLLEQIDIRQKECQQKGEEILQYKLKLQEINKDIAKYMQQNKINISHINKLNNLNHELKQILEEKQYQLQQKQNEIQYLQEQFQKYTTQQAEKVEELFQIKNNQLDELFAQKEQLKKNLQQQVEKELKLEQIIQKLSNQIDYYKNSIEQLYNQELQNQQLIKKMNQKFNLQIREQEIQEQQFIKLLNQYGKKNNDLIELKNQYNTLEQRLFLSENHIQNIEQKFSIQREEFRQIIDQIKTEKQELIVNLKKFQIYNQKLQIQMKQKFQEYKQNLQNKQNYFQTYVTNLNATKELELSQLEQKITQLKNQIQKNNAQLQYLRDFKKQKDKKKKKHNDQPPQTAYVHRQEPNSSNKIEKKNSKTPFLSQPKQQSSKISKTRSNPGQKILQHPKQESLENQNLDISHNSNEKKNYEISSKIAHEEIAINIITQNQRHKINQQEGMLQKSRNEQEISKSKQNLSLKESFILKNEKQNESSELIQQEFSEEQLKIKISTLQNKIQILQKQLTNKNEYVKQKQTEFQNQIQIFEINKMKQTFGFQNQFQQSLRKKQMEIKILMSENEENTKKMEDEKYKLITQLDIINKDYENLLQQYQNSKLINKQLKKLLQQSQQRLQESIYQVKQLQNIISQKQILIREFQEILNENTKQKQHYQKVIDDLNNQYQELIGKQKNIQNILNKVTQMLQKKQQELFQNQQHNYQLSTQIEKITEHKEMVIQQKQKYAQQLLEKLSLKDQELLLLNNKIHELAEYSVNLQKKSEYLSKCLLQQNIEFQTKQKQYGILAMDFNQLNDKYNLSKQNIQNQKKQIQIIKQQLQQSKLDKNNIVNDFIVQLKQQTKVKQINAEKVIKLEYQLQQKQTQFTIIKKDLAIFNLQNKKFKQQINKLKKQIQIQQQQFKQILTEHQQQKQQLNNQIQNSKSMINSFEKLLKQHQISQQEMIKIQAIRQRDRDILENKFRALTDQFQKYKTRILEQFTKKEEEKMKQVTKKYEQEMNLKNEQLKFMKHIQVQLRKQLQNQKQITYNYSCQYQQQKFQFDAERQQYKSKLKKYENQMLIVLEKFQAFQQNKINIQLFDEISFQNQIYRNRIAQLEQNNDIKIKIHENQIYKQYEQLKQKKQSEKKQFLIEIQNYSNQVNQLEQKNFNLKKQIEKLKKVQWQHPTKNISESIKIQQLEKDNRALEKQIARLENSEQQLKNEIELLKSKRQEEYKKYYNEIRILKLK